MKIELTEKSIDLLDAVFPNCYAVENNNVLPLYLRTATASELTKINDVMDIEPFDLRNTLAVYDKDSRKFIILNYGKKEYGTNL